MRLLFLLVTEKKKKYSKERIERETEVPRERREKKKEERE